MSERAVKRRASGLGGRQSSAVEDDFLAEAGTVVEGVVQAGGERRLVEVVVDETEAANVSRLEACRQGSNTRLDLLEAVVRPWNVAFAKLERANARLRRAVDGPGIFPSPLFGRDRLIDLGLLTWEHRHDNHFST